MQEGPIAGRYERLAIKREPYLQRARDAALLTIPSLFPPQGHTGAESLHVPRQSLGARGVNTTAAKLALTLMPPNSPFFRHEIDGFALDQLENLTNITRAEAESRLAIYDDALHKEMESAALRVEFEEAAKHTVVGGSALLLYTKEGSFRLFGLPFFVVRLSNQGKIRELITKETVAVADIDSDRVREAVQAVVGNEQEEVDLYTSYVRQKSGFKTAQEAGGITLPGTEGNVSEDKFPYVYLRWVSVSGESYGRSLVEEQRGDLQNFEDLTQYITEAAAAASWLVIGVRPGSSTNIKTVAEAKNGSVISADVNDVGAIQLNKYADLRVALERHQRLEQNLSYAFLIGTAVQRDAERVTAEEIRILTQELNDVLGGTYALLAREFQTQVVRLVKNHIPKSQLPSLPDELVTTKITTGIDALGRGHDFNRLRNWAESVAALPGAERYIGVNELMKRLAASLGIEPKDLILDEDTVAQADGQAQLREMVGKLGPQAIQAMSKASEQ